MSIRLFNLPLNTICQMLENCNNNDIDPHFDDLIYPKVGILYITLPILILFRNRRCCQHGFKVWLCYSSFASVINNTICDCAHLTDCDLTEIVRSFSDTSRITASPIWSFKSISRWRGSLRYRKTGLSSVKPQSHQSYDQVTTYLRPKNGPIVERTYEWSQRSHDWSQRSWVIARGKSVAARSWSCSKTSHTGLTSRLRPTCDRKMLE